MKKTRNFHGRNAWTPEADEILCSNLGLMHSASVAGKLNAILGTTFTADAVECRVRALGIDCRDCNGLLTIAEAARDIGIPMGTLWNFVTRNAIPTTGVGKYTFLTESGLQAAREFYKAAPEPSIPAAEAAKRLGYCRESMRRLWRLGRLPGHLFGSRLLIPLAEVERRERILRGIPLIGDRDVAV